jgi:hypothetical protein
VLKDGGTMMGAGFVAVLMFLILDGFICAKIKYTVIIPESNIFNIPPIPIAYEPLTQSYNLRSINHCARNQGNIFKDMVL